MAMQNYGYTTYPAPYDLQYPESTSVAGQGINLRFYWYAILERRWLVVITFLLVMAGALVYLMEAPRIYQATVVLQIDPISPTDVLTTENRPQAAVMDAAYLETQYKKLTSRSLLDTVVRRERLDQDPRYGRHMDIIDALAKDITVRPVRGTRLVNVSVYHTDPRKAASIANALAEEFIKQNANQRQKQILDLLFLLKTQATELERDVTQKEQAVQRYREQMSFVSFEASENVIAQALSQAHSQYAQAKAKTRVSEMLVQELDAHLKKGEGPETFPQIATDPEVSSLRAELTRLQNELTVLLRKYKEKHPAVIEAQSKIAAIEDSIRRIAQEKALLLRAQAELNRSEEQQMAENLKYWEERQMEWNKAKAQYDVLRRQADISAQLYTLILGKLKEIDLMTRTQSNNIMIVDPAVAPAMYVKPSLTMTLAGGTFGGLMLAIGLALLVAYMDDSIKGQDDVENYLKIPFLGYVPDIKAKESSTKALISHLQPQSNAAESFRSVRAAISLGAHGEQRRVLAVTSTLPAEGKTLCATNIAIVVAQTGLKTILVDADMRRPSIHRNFELDRSKGLSSFLAGEILHIDEIIQPTKVPNLDIITAGPKVNQPAELISSKNMERLIEELSTRYERIIIDTPPVSAVSDPLVVASMADGVVYVIKFNKIRRDLARKCIQRLLDSGASIAGAVLNDLDFEGRDAYYAYYYYTHYYYYQSRYYYGYGKKRRRAHKEKEPNVSAGAGEANDVSKPLTSSSSSA